MKNNLILTVLFLFFCTPVLSQNQTIKKLHVESKNNGTVIMLESNKKLNLETKVCQNCNRPFAWRKKWERVWDEVRFCSRKCKAESKKS